MDRPPKILPRLTPRAPEVTRNRIPGKKENGIFGISSPLIGTQHVEGVQKNHHLPCIFHAFGEKI